MNKCQILEALQMYSKFTELFADDFDTWATSDVSQGFEDFLVSVESGDTRTYLDMLEERFEDFEYMEAEELKDYFRLKNYIERGVK